MYLTTALPILTTLLSLTSALPTLTPRQAPPPFERLRPTVLNIIEGDRVIESSSVDEPALRRPGEIFSDRSRPSRDVAATFFPSARLGPRASCQVSIVLGDGQDTEGFQALGQPFGPAEGVIRGSGEIEWLTPDVLPSFVPRNQLPARFVSNDRLVGFLRAQLQDSSAFIGGRNTVEVPTGQPFGVYLASAADDLNQISWEEIAAPNRNIGLFAFCRPLA